MVFGPRRASIIVTPPACVFAGERNYFARSRALMKALALISPLAASCCLAPILMQIQFDPGARVLSCHLFAALLSFLKC
jgi:hypothetical protein